MPIELNIMYGVFNLKSTIFKKLIKIKYSKLAQTSHIIRSALILFICLFCCLILLVLLKKEKDNGRKMQETRMKREKVHVDKKRINMLLSKLEKNGFLVWLNRTKSNEWIIYQREIEKYFDLAGNKEILVNDKFMAMIKNMNNNFVNIHLDVSARREKIVFVSAANADFFKPLKHSVKLKNLYFPKNKMVVYDLGMSSSMVDELIEFCQCEVKPFKNARPDHFKNLHTYSWKPFIVQVTLKINKICTFYMIFLIPILFFCSSFYSVSMYRWSKDYSLFVNELADCYFSSYLLQGFS